MALGRQLARPPHVVGATRTPANEIAAGDDFVVGDDVAVFEREDVERAKELLALEDERNGERAAAPVRHERGAPRQVGKREVVDERNRVHHARRRRRRVQPIGSEGMQPGAEDATQIGPSPASAVRSAQKARKTPSAHYRQRQLSAFSYQFTRVVPGLSNQYPGIPSLNSRLRSRVP